MSAVYEIGNPDGRISVRLDRDEALQLAALYGPDDEQAWELLEAVRVAYPGSVRPRASGKLAFLVYHRASNNVVAEFETREEAEAALVDWAGCEVLVWGDAA